jgi:hypothetical protein
MSDFSSQLDFLINGLAKVLLDNLLNEEIDKEEAQEISQYILDEKRKIVTKEQINDFLERLKQRYLIFDQFIEQFQKSTNIQNQDQQKIEEIKNQLLKFSQSSQN